MDPFSSQQAGLEAPATRHFQIVPNDGADLAVKPRAIFCQAGGTIVVRDDAGVDLPYGMTQGAILPIRPSRVLSTGTSGTYYGVY